MRKIFFVLLTLVLVYQTVVAAEKGEYKFVTRVELEKGEKWWGINISEKPFEYFRKPFVTNSVDGISPLMLSSNGRYIWSSEPLKVEFDGRTIIVSSDKEKVEAVKAGKTLRDAYIVCCHKNFPPKCDIPAESDFTLPVYYGDDVWNDADLINYAGEIAAKGLPKGVINISKWRSVHGYDFDPELYPDPKATVNKLKTMGFSVQLEISDRIVPYGKLFYEMLRSDQLIESCDSGNIKYYYNWGLLEVEAQIRDLVSKAKDYGIDSFEILAGVEHNKARANVDFAEKLGIRTGVCVREYVFDENDISGTIGRLTAASLSGYPFNTVIPATLLNGTAAESQIMAYNGVAVAMPSAKIVLPQNMLENPEYCGRIKRLLDFRGSINGYILSLVNECRQTAEPMIRLMEYQFPKMGFADCDDQFMLGPKYLFAPVVEGESKRIVRLPKGVWIDRNGKRFKGPLVTQADCSDGRLVWFELKSNK